MVCVIYAIKTGLEPITAPLSGMDILSGYITSKIRWENLWYECGTSTLKGPISNHCVIDFSRLLKPFYLYDLLVKY